MRIRTVLALATLVLLSSTAWSHEHHAHPAPANPAWDRMKTLTGNWEGTAKGDGKEFPSKTSFRMVSGNSVLMNTLAEGTPHEMITMFHLDFQDLLATHYCGAQNQPRFKAVPGDAPNQIKFEFKDGTNIGPDDGYMQRVIFTFVDADHHNEDWIFAEKGKESSMHFEFHRKP